MRSRHKKQREWLRMLKARWVENEVPVYIRPLRECIEVNYGES